MRIDWRSLERIEEAGQTASYLDVSGGTFLADHVPPSRRLSPGSRVIALEGLVGIDPAQLEKALMAFIPDERLRRRTFAAWRAHDRVCATARHFTSQETWIRQRDQKREELESLLSRSPAIAQRWRQSATLRTRLELWSCLCQEGIDVDNPPEWIGETVRLRDDFERGWPAFIQSRLQVIEQWLSATAPEIVDDLKPPASDSAISALELTLVECGARPFGPDLRALFRWHDGTMHRRGASATTSLFLGFWLLSVEDALGACELMCALERTLPAGSACSPRWDPRWLPVLSNGIGDFWFLDLRPGSRPTVVEYLHEDPDTNAVLFKDLASFIEAYADAIDDGLLVYDADCGVQPRSWHEWSAHCSLYGGRGGDVTSS